MPPSDMRTNSRPKARAIEWPSEVLPTPGGPTKQRIGSRLIVLLVGAFAGAVVGVADAVDAVDVACSSPVALASAWRVSLRWRTARYSRIRAFTFSRS